MTAPAAPRHRMTKAEEQALIERGRLRIARLDEEAKLLHFFVPHKQDNVCDRCARFADEPPHVGGQLVLPLERLEAAP